MVCDYYVEGGAEQDPVKGREQSRTEDSAPTISFCMIAKNAAPTLKLCLETIANLCDEIVVVDTGSTDDTENIAKSYGARVLRVPWSNDFSVARNAYVVEARSNWILSLDADETLGEVDKSKFRKWLAHSRSAGFIFTIRNYYRKDDFPEALFPSRWKGEISSGLGFVVSKTVRLFRRQPAIRYCYPVHESLLPALKHSGGRVSSCSIPIHHFGYLEATESIEVKCSLYHELGLRKIREYPKHFLGYMEVGTVLLHKGHFEEALTMFRESMRLRPQCNEAHLYSALALLRMGKYAACRSESCEVLRHSPGHQDALYLLKLLDSVDGADWIPRRLY